MVIDDGDGPFIPFFDHRRSGGLANATVRRIVYSMQHIGVRERNPDLADARLAVVRFPASGEERTLTVHFNDGGDLMSYEELDAGVRTVSRPGPVCQMTETGRGVRQVAAARLRLDSEAYEGGMTAQFGDSVSIRRRRRR